MTGSCYCSYGVKQQRSGRTTNMSAVRPKGWGFKGPLQAAGCCTFLQKYVSIMVPEHQHAPGGVRAEWSVQLHSMTVELHVPCGLWVAVLYKGL